MNSAHRQHTNDRKTTSPILVPTVCTARVLDTARDRKSHSSRDEEGEVSKKLSPEARGAL